MSEEKNLNGKSKETLFIISVGGLAIFSGFAYAINATKKSHSSILLSTDKVQAVESGTRLALRALGYGSLFCVGGVSLLTMTSCLLFGINSWETFNAKMRKLIPQASKKPSQGRSDFGSVRELVDFLIEEDRKAKDL